MNKNAEKYAKEHHDIPFEHDSGIKVIVAEESYTAGPKSMLDEIRELKGKLLAKDIELMKVLVDNALLQQEVNSLNGSNNYYLSFFLIFDMSHLNRKVRNR